MHLEGAHGRLLVRGLVSHPCPLSTYSSVSGCQACMPVIKKVPDAVQHLSSSGILLCTATGMPEPLTTG
jgi:hypothetical protein